MMEDSTSAAPYGIRLGKTVRSGAGGAVAFDGTNFCIGQASADSSTLVRTVRGLIAHHLTDLEYETKIDFNADMPINCTLASAVIPQIAPMLRNFCPATMVWCGTIPSVCCGAWAIPRYVPTASAAPTAIRPLPRWSHCGAACPAKRTRSPG